MAASLSRLHLLSRRTAHQLKGPGDPQFSRIMTFPP